MARPRAIVVPKGIYEFNRVTDAKRGMYTLSSVHIVARDGGMATAKATNGKALVAAWWNEHNKEDNEGYIDSVPPVVDEQYFPTFSDHWPETESTTSFRVDARQLIPLLEAMAAVCTDAEGKASMVLTIGLMPGRNQLLLTAEHNECKVAGAVLGLRLGEDVCHLKTPLFDPRTMETGR